MTGGKTARSAPSAELPEQTPISGTDASARLAARPGMKGMTAARTMISSLRAERNSQRHPLKLTDKKLLKIQNEVILKLSKSAIKNGCPRT